MENSVELKTIRTSPAFEVQFLALEDTAFAVCSCGFFVLLLCCFLEIYSLQLWIKEEK